MDVERFTEWEPRELELTADERVELLALAKPGSVAGDERRVVQALAPTSSDGRLSITFGSVSGRLALRSGRVLDLRSRLVDNDGVLQLLQVTGRLPDVLREAPTPGAVGWGVVDVLAVALSREVDRLVGEGLAKDYVPHRVERPPYPGALDVREHLGRFAARADRLVTRTRRLTADTPRNQALAAAVAALQRCGLQPSARRAIERTAGALRSISASVLDPSGVRALIGAHRLGRYDPALRLAALVADGRGLEASGAGLPSASVLFHLPSLWEDYVAAWVQVTHPGRRVTTQHPFAVTEGGEITGRADVVVLADGEQPAELFDAKYKRVGAVPSAGDVYQMVTYCQRWQVQRATLVYPGAGPTTSVRVGDVRVEVVRLPVLTSPTRPVG